MPYLFYGEDNYSIRSKLKSLKDNFFKKNQDYADLIEKDGDNLTKNEFISTCLAVPFLSSKKLIIIKNLLLKNTDQILKDYIKDNIGKLPDTSIVIFVEFGIPDKRSSLFKKINQVKFAQSFNLFERNKFNHWVNEKIKSEDIRINPYAAEKFISYLNNDMYRAENEILKLKSYYQSKSEELSLDDIEKTVANENQADIFQFIDAVAQKNSKQSILYLHNLINSGKNELYILTMIAYQLRNMIVVSELLSFGRNKSQIAQEAKIHPFVVGKILNIIKQYSLSTIKNNYQKLCLFDYKIKSGQIEQKLALDLLVIQISK